MAKRSEAIGKFYAEDIATIGDDETYTTDSDEIDVRDCEYIAVQGYCTCGSACAATTVIKLAAKVQGNWDAGGSGDENEFVEFSITQVAGVTVRKTILICCVGIDSLKIMSIENKEDDNTNGDITAVNVAYSKE